MFAEKPAGIIATATFSALKNAKTIIIKTTITTFSAMERSSSSRRPDTRRATRCCF